MFTYNYRAAAERRGNIGPAPSIKARLTRISADTPGINVHFCWVLDKTHIY